MIMKNKIFEFIVKILYSLIFFNTQVLAEEIQIIEKISDRCPIGFYTSGGFCKSYKNNKRKAILNRSNLQCPSGFFQSAKFYCLSYEKIK